jgi:two-component system nitrate/nitrite sensor histidine kinase NarX
MNLDQLPSRHSLSTKLLVLSVLWLVVAMVSIGFTLLLSWKLEGGAAAINDAGSLRMRTYRTVMLLSQNESPAVVEEQRRLFQTTLDRLIAGDPARPLFLPDTPEVHAQAAWIREHWQLRMVPLLQPGQLQSNGAQLLDREADAFVDGIDRLVRLIEIDNARNTSMLRVFQLVLIGMATVGALSMMYLLYILVILPVNQLHQGMQRLSQGDLGSRVDLDRQDEFGALSDGFNQMADRLQGLVQTMEQQVRDKTRELESNNRQLTALYQVTAFLHQSQDLEQTCEGFLQQVMLLTGASAGAVRLLDSERGKIDAVVQIGLPDTLLTQQECSRVNACYCGQSVQTGETVLRRIDRMEHTVPLLPSLPCQNAGFDAVSVFQIRASQQDLGIFTLFFRDGEQPGEEARQLLEALGSHLGVAIANTRLAARDRQLAVMEERNLMAQGLHDSIAQSLSFLNLQVQMLEAAVAAGEQEQARENLAFIRAGVQESYDDVRELLLNFRVRISKEELPEAVQTLLSRFEAQTGVHTSLDMGGDGLPLDPQQQLQVIFILQEALSNVRKHAQADSVAVTIRNDDDFVMSIADNGRGIDADEMEARRERHVGLSIMQERARRIHASVTITRQAAGGTLVSLLLPQKERIAT